MSEDNERLTAKDALNEVIDAIQAFLPVNRVVAIVTVLCAGLASSFAIWLRAKGVDVEPSVLIAGLASLVGSLTTIGYKFIDGWQKDEERQSALQLERIESERFEAEAKFHGQDPLPDEDVSSLQALGAGLGDLRQQVAGGETTSAEVVDTLDSFIASLARSVPAQDEEFDDGGEQ